MRENELAVCIGACIVQVKWIKQCMHIPVKNSTTQWMVKGIHCCKYLPWSIHPASMLTIEMQTACFPELDFLGKWSFRV